MTGKKFHQRMGWKHQTKLPESEISKYVTPSSHHSSNIPRLFTIPFYFFTVHFPLIRHQSGANKTQEPSPESHRDQLTDLTLSVTRPVDKVASRAGDLPLSILPKLKKQQKKLTWLPLRNTHLHTKSLEPVNINLKITRLKLIISNTNLFIFQPLASALSERHSDCPTDEALKGCWAISRWPLGPRYSSLSNTTTSISARDGVQKSLQSIRHVWKRTTHVRMRPHK